MTHSDGLAALAATLDVPPGRLDMLTSCDEAQLRALDTLIAEAKSAEDVAIDESLEQALTFVPRLLRGIARGIVFPGESK